MTCLITSYLLNLNSSEYRDSCYVTWLGSSFCLVTKETMNTHTQFWMDVYGSMVPGFAHLEVAMQKLARSIWHRNCLYSLRNSNLSGTLWQSKSLYQILFKSNSQMVYLSQQLLLHDKVLQDIHLMQLLSSTISKKNLMIIRAQFCKAVKQKILLSKLLC